MKYYQDAFLGGGHILLLGKNTDHVIPIRSIYKQTISTKKSSNLMLSSRLIIYLTS